MRAGSYGRIVFGAASVLFGAIAFAWHDSATWQQLAVIPALPSGGIIADILAVAQIAGGIGVLFAPSVRAGSLLLAAVYLLFCAASIPGILAAPSVYQSYGSFFEQFPLLCGAVALFAATQTPAERAASLERAARLGLGASALSFALDQAFYLRATAALVPGWIPPSQTFWAVVTTIFFALAALATIVNVRARLAMRLLGLMLALFGLLVWIPQLLAHSHAHGNWSEFALNFQITGAVWAAAETRSFS